MHRFWLLLFLVTAVLAQNENRLQDGFDQLDAGNPQNAAAIFQSILETDPKNAEAWCGLGRSLDIVDPGSADAERALNRAVRHNRRYGEAYYYLAVMWTHRPNRHKEALEQLKLAVHFSPKLVEAWELLGHLHEQNANEKPAVLAFSDGLLENPQAESLYDNFLRTAFDYQYEKSAIKTLNKYAEVNDNPRINIDLADAHRRLGEVEKAAEIFAAINVTELTDSQSHAHLVNARILFDLQKDESGCEQYWQAVNAISDSADRRSFFKDVCFILQDDEYDLHNAAPNDSLPLFYQRLWRSRDPNLATSLNERIPEHFRRLTKAEKEWRRSPVGYKHSILIHQRTSDGGESLATFRDVNLVGDEFLEAAHMPKALPRDRTLDDLAVVYLRHGDPSREIFPNLSRAGYNKTWLYQKNEQHPEMVFHFQRLGEHTGWILEAVPGNTENLETLHGRYIQLQDVETDASDDEYETDETALRPQARGWAQEIIRENLTYLEQAMTTETSSYTTPETPIQLPYQYLFFKGQDKSEVELFYLIHGGIVDLDSAESKIDVDEYLTIHDDKWDEVQRLTRKVERVMNLTPQQWAGSGFAMRESFPLDPGDYFSELQAVDNIGVKRAIHKDSLYIPDFSGDQLMVSDVLIASEIDETQSSVFQRNGVPFMPHMFYGFPVNGFVGVYFEIYNLKLDDAGTTRYEVSFTMQRADLQEREQSQTVLGFVKNLFMDKRQVTSRFENEGRTADDYIYMNLQFPDRKSGQYDLIIRIKDMQSGQVTSTQAKITLL